MANAAIQAVRKATAVFMRVEAHLQRRGVTLSHLVSGGGQQNVLFVGSREHGKYFTFQVDMTIDGRQGTAGSRIRITLHFQDESGERSYYFLPRYRVYYDAKRGEWRMNNRFLGDLPAALRISAKLPKGKLTEKQAMRVVDILADHFVAQDTMKPRVPAQA